MNFLSQNPKRRKRKINKSNWKIHYKNLLRKSVIMLDSQDELGKILNKLGEYDIDFDYVASVLNDSSLKEKEKVEILQKLLPRKKY